VGARFAGPHSTPRQEVKVETARKRPGGWVARVMLVVALAVGLLAFGGVGPFVRSGAPPPPAVSAELAAALAEMPVAASRSLSGTIAALEIRLEAFPADWRSLATLGLAYVQQARITTDASFYPKAQAVLDHSLSLHPVGNFEALTGMSALELARHDFAGALRWGREALAINPHSANAHGVVGDALVELGRYQSGFEQFQQMVDLRPGLASYARASYARELQGDVQGAVTIMRLALQAAGSSQDRAWAHNQLGDLAFSVGDLVEAERNYTLAQGWDRSFVPPLAGRARVAAAKGDIEEAIRRYRQVVAVHPLPEYVMALGDLYTVMGDKAAAAEQFELVRAEEQLFRANGVNVDLEVALFHTDHGIRLDDGLAAANAEWKRHHSVHAADALGWALHAFGRDGQALSYTNRALALGTQNAQFLFHRGMIERSLGHAEAARRDLRRALSINPHFSILWSRRAAAVLHDLETAR
jgi:tetratricopeptide (TPR) repeat protein